MGKTKKIEEKLRFHNAIVDLTNLYSKIADNLKPLANEVSPQRASL